MEVVTFLRPSVLRSMIQWLIAALMSSEKSDIILEKVSPEQREIGDV